MTDAPHPITPEERQAILRRLRRVFPSAVTQVVAVSGPPEAKSRGVLLYGADRRPATAPFPVRPAALARLMHDAARLSDTTLTVHLHRMTPER